MPHVTTSPLDVMGSRLTLQVQNRTKMSTAHQLSSPPQLSNANQLSTALQLSSAPQLALGPRGRAEGSHSAISSTGRNMMHSSTLTCGNASYSRTDTGFLGKKQLRVRFSSGSAPPMLLRRFSDARQMGAAPSVSPLVSQKEATVRSVRPMVSCSAVPLDSPNLSPGTEIEKGNGVKEGFWTWKGYNIRYQAAGTEGPPIVLIHGFGANCDHWRKNIAPLSDSHRVYAIDLLGYGYSSKPDPKLPTPELPSSSPYKFETWGAQVNDFISEVVGEPAFLACNSVGGLAGLQAAVSNSSLSRGIVLLNISLRLLHITKQSPFARPAVAALQSVLRNTDLGKMFFKSVATPRAVSNILKECYGDATAVTPELVDAILKPGLEPGAADVFLDFICYSAGPLPEDLIPQVKCPVIIGWGESDPWEPVKLGRAYGEFETVEDFVVFPGVGHCPQDEAPQLINPFIASFVARHS